jgi:hypothetical protein
MQINFDAFLSSIFVVSSGCASLSRSTALYACMIKQSVVRVAVDAAQDSTSMQLGACACIMEQSSMCVAVVPGRDSMIDQPSVRA